MQNGTDTLQTNYSYFDALQTFWNSKEECNIQKWNSFPSLSPQIPQSKGIKDWKQVLLALGDNIQMNYI